MPPTDIPTPTWTRRADLPDLPHWARHELDSLPVIRVGGGAVLFRPGQAAEGFVVVLSGRIDCS